MGAAGSGTPGVRTAGTCPILPGVISDFEEGPPAATDPGPSVINSEGRNGTWYTYNDAASGATETMTVEASGGTADCDKYALHVKGSGYASYAGLGMNFAGGKVPAAYDGTSHQFTGIKFKAKLGSTAAAKPPVHFALAIPATQSNTQPGGTCVDATADDAPKCYQHMGKYIPPGTAAGQLTSTFQTFTYCFDRDLYPASLPSIATNAQREALGSTLLQLQFDFNLGKDYTAQPDATTRAYPAFDSKGAFDFWVDDVQFFTGACPNMTPSPSTGAPAKAFPQNTAVGSCMAASNASTLSGEIAKAYATWTKNFVQSGKVVSPEDSNHVSSEAMGYGMLIAAAIGDKTAFDSFWTYVKSKLGSSGLMDWREDQSGAGSASDADFDIAYALLMANQQWPSGNYKTGSPGADSIIAAAASKDLASNVVIGGSNFASSPYNPSYFAPGWFRKFGSSFSGALTTNYTLVNTNVSSPTAGVPTDWADKGTGKPSGPGSAQVTSQIQDASGAMGYDAARVPYRLGIDACLGGTDTTSVKSIASFFNTKYPSIDLMKGGYIKSSGATHPKAVAMQGSYIGSMGIAAMAAGNTAMRDRAFRTMLDVLENGDFNHTYYPSTVGLLTMLIMAGDFPTVQ